MLNIKRLTAYESKAKNNFKGNTGKSQRTDSMKKGLYFYQIQEDKTARQLEGN